MLLSTRRLVGLPRVGARGIHERAGAVAEPPVQVHEQGQVGGRRVAGDQGRVELDLFLGVEVAHVGERLPIERSIHLHADTGEVWMRLHEGGVRGVVVRGLVNLEFDLIVASGSHRHAEAARGAAGAAQRQIQQDRAELELLAAVMLGAAAAARLVDALELDLAEHQLHLVDHQGVAAVGEGLGRPDGRHGYRRGGGRRPVGWLR